VSRTASSDARIASALEALVGRFDDRFLDTDPLGIVRRFPDPSDREVAGLLAAGLAYGRVASIRASLERLFAILGKRPSRFVDALDLRRDARRLEAFVHRFHTGRDVAVLLSLVRRARESSGSLEAFFADADPDPGSETIGPALDRFGERLFALGEVAAADRVRFFLPLPARGSVCKRSCLFLRWMVRPEDGVDCGVWTRVSPSRLVLPLDTHLIRVVRALGWTRRSSPGWAMALEATSRLRRIDPNDPVRFDFALSRLGILGLLKAPGGRLDRRVLEGVLAEAGAA
jgi:uncharacterized protein (TIGR02757 family)